MLEEMFYDLLHWKQQEEWFFALFQLTAALQEK